MTDPIKRQIADLTEGNLATDGPVSVPGQPDGDDATYRYVITPEIVEEAASFTFSLATHGGKIVHSTSATPITITLPNNVVLPVVCVVNQMGAGAITFAPASGATLVNVNLTYTTIGAGSTAFLQWTGNVDTSHAAWKVNGDLN